METFGNCGRYVNRFELFSDNLQSMLVFKFESANRHGDLIVIAIVHAPRLSVLRYLR